MPHHQLTADELTALVRRVFAPRTSDRGLAILVDLPDEALPDKPAWRLRREMAAGWAHELTAARSLHGLEIALFLYRNVRANGADLPAALVRHARGVIPDHADAIEGLPSEPLERVLTEYSLVLVPTELSATAPLKVLARTLRFRAATMPGFTPEMVPALRLDYAEISRRVGVLKDLLDRATGARLEFLVDGATRHDLFLDLRHRTAHASGGLIPEPGTAGNLPSGEAYIVPYEGELPGEPTRSAGEMPVQHRDEVVVYQVVANRAVAVASVGPESTHEAALLAAEPARGNLAELGLGVLADFGVEPIGEVLLDEKLGLHLAFGRSDHFGGQVGARQFSRPEAVIHQDYVYVARLQPRVLAARVDLELADGSLLPLMRDGRYVIAF